ncbi:MAG TPA: GNAT family N-acetyltransferase [Acidimicrobiales bacterium]|nr:GNAT family N-acetyltransferase [Acidimicrobiales bacterium]
MPKSRLGVALLVPPPLREEVDGLRRALGDPALGRIPAHLTLVPPVNVRDDAVPNALAVLRAAAAATRPFRLTLGPPATFLPDNPVLYLSASGDLGALHALHALRDRVFTPPLERTLTWPFVPHVTIADEAPPARIEAALSALSSYAAEALFERVHLLQEGEGRVWSPIADAAFAAPAVVGRGGLPLELAVTEHLDREAAQFEAAEWAAVAAAPTRLPLAVTARRDGRIVGAAAGRVVPDDDSAHLSSLVVAADERGTGVGAQLVAAFLSAAAERGARSVTVRTREDGFYRRLGWVETARLDDRFVQLCRTLS